MVNRCMVNKKYNKIIEVNELMHDLMQKHPFTDLINSPVFINLYGMFMNEVKKQICKRRCGWCNSKVKVSKLSASDKQVFYSSSLCPNCEDTYARPINLN